MLDESQPARGEGPPASDAGVAPSSPASAAPGSDLDVGDAQATKDIKAMLEPKKPDPPAPPTDGDDKRRPREPSAWPWIMLGAVLGMVTLALYAVWRARHAPPPAA